MPTADKLEAGKAGPDHDTERQAAIDAAITRRLADLGLDDADARADLADLRAGLASLRKLRFGLIQKCVGWFVQAALMLMALVAAQNQALALTLDLEREKLAARASLIAAEIGGQSWLQRNCRPITMLSFLVLVILDAFGLLVFRLSDEAWLLLQINLGGYVVGRSAEKMLPAIRVGVNKGHAGHAGHHD